MEEIFALQKFGWATLFFRNHLIFLTFTAPCYHLLVVSEGVVNSLRKKKEFYLTQSSDPCLSDALNWLYTNLSEIEKLPVSLTHGDFNPGNIIVHRRYTNIAVNGIIDFENSRPDPSIMDYSQVITMAVCHSGADNASIYAERAFSLLEKRFSRRQLEVAMMAYWFDLRQRWKSNPEAEDKLTRRVKQVWSFIQSS